MYIYHQVHSDGFNPGQGFSGDFYCVKSNQEITSVACDQNIRTDRNRVSIFGSSLEFGCKLPCVRSYVISIYGLCDLSNILLSKNRVNKSANDSKSVKCSFFVHLTMFFKLTSMCIYYMILITHSQ